MPAIYIQDLDDAVLEALEARAKARHRSLTSEVKAILTDVAAGEPTVVVSGDVHHRRPMQLHFANVGAATTFSRDELYGDDSG